MSNGLSGATNGKGTLLEVRDLHKEYAFGKLHVLKGISFTVSPGERIAIVGKSGAGKSTLLHLLGTLDRPTAGTITFGGQDVFRRRSSRRSRSARPGSP